jgi:hypothetical protein
MLSQVMLIMQGAAQRLGTVVNPGVKYAMRATASRITALWAATAASSPQQKGPQLATNKAGMAV